MIVTGHDQITHIVPEEHAIQNHQRAARIISEALARMEGLTTSPGPWNKNETAEFAALATWLPFNDVLAIAVSGPER